MNKIHLTKEYERDISMIVEALWAQKLATYICERLKIQAPYHPFIIFYMTDENMQIWENAEALSWLRNQLFGENEKGIDFIKEVISEYGKIVEELEIFWNNGPTADKEALKNYMGLMGEAISRYSLWYYSLIDERTPKNILDIIVELRNGDEIFAKSDIFVKDCVEALGQKRELANFIMPEEFPDLPETAVLEARKKGIVSEDGNNCIQITLEDFAKKHPEYIFEGLNDSVENVSKIKGQAAFIGNVKGLIRIVKNKKQMQELKVGEIMVSPMTTPDFMPAMKKAAAFVTDEGGITCHAAIVAREMKKPCIIGTKIATKVLHDGDLVEVNADKGIVKIIKHAKR